MLFLRQSTASQEILLGPFVDSTDGNTQETALTINNTDIKLWKEGGTTEASKNSGGATHIASGRYYAVLDATDTDTVGKLEVNVHVTGALAVRREFMVLEEAVYDALFAASAAGYQVPIWAAAGSTVNLSATTVSAVSGAVGSVTGAVGSVTGNVGGNVTGSVGSVAAGGITASSIATGAIDADALATDAVAEIADGVWDEAISGHLSAGSTGEALDNAGAAGTPPTAAAIADAVWDEARSGHTTAGTFGQGVASVQGGVTGNISGDVIGGVLGDVENVLQVVSLSTDAITSTSLATSAVSEIVSAVLTTALTESYNTDGAAPTLTQAVLLALQILSESSVAGTTLTVKKLDGSTTAATFTLNDATTPTSITRAN